MDIYTISRILKDGIMTHKRLAVPKWGLFESREVNSVISDNGRVISPPSFNICFTPFTEEQPDCEGFEEIVKTYSEGRSITVDHARSVLLFYLSDLKVKMLNNKTLYLPGIGQFDLDQEGKIVFRYESPVPYLPIEVTPLKVKGVLEELPESHKKAIDIAKEEVAAYRKKRNKWKWVFLSVAILVVLLCFLAFIFKEELRPLWEILLYNEEERAILRKMI